MLAIIFHGIFLFYLNVVCEVSEMCEQTIENGLISKYTTKHLARLYLK